MQEQIQALTDDEALALLTSIARAHERGSDFITDATPEIAVALQEALDAGEGTQAAPTDGEAARAALAVLAETEPFRGPIAALLEGPPAQTRAFGAVATTLLISGVLLALQTHVKIERDADGRWKVKIEKKPTNTTLLAPLVKKLLALLGA